MKKLEKNQKNQNLKKKYDEDANPLVIKKHQLIRKHDNAEITDEDFFREIEEVQTKIDNQIKDYLKREKRG